MSLRTTVLTVLLLAPFTTHAQTPLTLDQAMADPDWIGPPVEQAWWSWDGSRVNYVLKRTGSVVRDTWTVPAAGGTPQRVELPAIVGLIGILSRVKLDGVRSKPGGALHCLLSRIDEKTGANARFLECRDRILDSRAFAEQIETALGSNLFALLRDEGHLLRSNAESGGDHRLGTCRFEIEVGGYRSCESLDVGVLNVSSIFAQVRSDSVCSRKLAHCGGLDRRRLKAAPRLSQSRDMIDVHVEA
jgi:hypothetical protein